MIQDDCNQNETEQPGEETGDDYDSDCDPEKIMQQPGYDVEETEIIAPRKLYKRRWFMLFVFALSCVGNAVSFTSVAAIANVASAYYNVEPSVINWIPNSFLIVYVFIGLPSAYTISSLGLRVALLLGASLNGISCCLHFAGNGRDGFAFVMAGQICAAVAVGAMLQIPAKLATIWFGIDEHATATSIGYVVNILGMAIGYVQSTQMVPVTDNMNDVATGIYYMNLSQMIYVLVTLLVTYAAFRSRPPSPSSNLVTSCDQGSKVPPFTKCLRLLAEDRDFNLYTQAYAICFGIFTFYCIVLNEMVSTKMSDGLIGWMGFSCNLFGIVNMLLCGVIVDKYKCYKLMSVLLILGSLADWIAFILVLLNTDNIILIFILYSLLGFFTIPLMSVGVEQVAVTTYPVPEETSGGIILIFGNLYGFVLVLFLGDWVAKGYIPVVCYITVGLLALALVFACASRVKLKKLCTEYHRVADTGSLDQVT